MMESAEANNTLKRNRNQNARGETVPTKARRGLDGGKGSSGKGKGSAKGLTLEKFFKYLANFDGECRELSMENQDLVTNQIPAAVAKVKEEDEDIDEVIKEMRKIKPATDGTELYGDFCKYDLKEAVKDYDDAADDLEELKNDQSKVKAELCDTISDYKELLIEAASLTMSLSMSMKTSVACEQAGATPCV